MIGCEPQITGEWPQDPHAPWQVCYAGIGKTDLYAVQYMGSEELVLLYDDEASKEGMDKEAAQDLAERLNEISAKKYCCVDESGLCSICGDVMAMHDDVYEFLKPVKREDGTYYWLASTSLT